MGEEFVEVARFIDVSEAHMARGLLTSNGIDAIINDENIVTANAFLAVATGGVRLSVPRAQSRDARALLQEVRRGEFFEASDGVVAKRADEDLAIERCPACGSQDVFRPRSLLGALLFIAETIPAIFATRRRVCRGCHHEWRAKTRRPVIPQSDEVSAALGRRG